MTVERTAPDDLAGRPALKGERFVLFGKIAEGGMAGIYRAWDAKLLGWRAVKVLLPEFAQRRKLRNRFESEARAMAAIDHPNVVRVYDVVTDAALPYLVMEIADGGSLSDWLEKNGSMPPRLAVAAVEQIGRGLSAAHAAGVVHRDVKPQNVLLDRRGHCMVSDFGIARVEFLDSMTRTGTSMGTIGYMAPEQRTDAKVVDVRADVYALGALLYKLLTSVVLTDMFMVGLDEELIEPIPDALRPAMIKACHHDRDDRWPDVASFVAALLAVKGELPDDPPDTPPLGHRVEAAPLDTSSRVFSAISSVLVSMPGAHVPFDQTVPMAIDSMGGMPEDTHEATMTEPSAQAARPTRPARTQPTVDRAKPAQRPVLLVQRAPRTSWFWATVASGIGVGAVLASALGFSVWTLQAARGRELEARAELYRAIDVDRPALDLAAEHSRDPAELAVLLSSHANYTTASQEPNRQSAADAYVTLLLEHTDPLVEEGVAGRAEVQIRNLAEAQRTWRDARGGLLRARTRPPGYWATLVGF